jgi:hypothetical protein
MLPVLMMTVFGFVTLDFFAAITKVSKQRQD